MTSIQIQSLLAERLSGMTIPTTLLARETVKDAHKNYGTGNVVGNADLASNADCNVCLAMKPLAITNADRRQIISSNAAYPSKI